jgi:hypothetical protein
MGSKIEEGKTKLLIRLAEIVSLVLINLIWLVVILIWFLQYLDNEIGQAVRIYCFGYGVYSKGIVMFRTITMLSTPALLSLVLFSIFYKSPFFRKAFLLSNIFIFAIFSSANIIGRKINKPLELGYNLQISEIPDNLELFDENGEKFSFDGSKIYITTFFYSRCRASCPLQIELFSKLSKKFPNCTFLLISFDPRDKKERLYELKVKHQLKDNVKLLNSESKNFRRFLTSLRFLETNFESDVLQHPVIFLISNGRKVVKTTSEINEEKIENFLKEFAKLK